MKFPATLTKLLLCTHTQAMNSNKAHWHLILKLSPCFHNSAKNQLHIELNPSNNSWTSHTKMKRGQVPSPLDFCWFPFWVSVFFGSTTTTLQQSNQTKEKLRWKCREFLTLFLRCLAAKPPPDPRFSENWVEFLQDGTLQKLFATSNSKWCQITPPKPQSTISPRIQLGPRREFRLDRWTRSTAAGKSTLPANPKEKKRTSTMQGHLH